MASPEGKEDAVTTDDIRDNVYDAVGGNVDNDAGVNAEDNTTKGAQQMKYELHVAMKYQRGKTFEVDASIPCEFEKYMTWHYVLGNPTIFNDKCRILKRENDLDIVIETIEGDKWLIIDKGNVSTKLADPEIIKTRDLIVHALLRGADTLSTKSFSTTGVDKKNFTELMMEKIVSTYGCKFLLFTDQESDLVHCVYQKEMSNFVESVSKEIFTNIQIVQKHLEQKLVFSKVLKSFKVRQQVKDKYKHKVKMAVDSKETTNSCRLTLQGQKSEVESVEKWIQDTYIKEFVFIELSIDDIRYVSNSHDIERIAKEVFQEFTEVFWYFNSICGKMGICSKTANVTDQAMVALKMCLKKCEYPIKVKQDLDAMPELRDGRACIEGISENSAKVCVIGTKSVLQKIDERLNAERKSIEKHDDQPKVVKIRLRVDDEADVEIIRRSPEFNSFNGVEIEEISEGEHFCFLLSGRSSMCSDVRRKLTQRIIENKERMKGAAKKHWDLQNGHDTVQASCDTAVSEDIDGLVDTVAHKKGISNLHTKILEGGIRFKEVTDQVAGAKTFEERSNTNKAIRDKSKPIHYMKGTSNLETNSLEGGICFKEVTDQVAGAKMDVKDTELLKTMGITVTGNEKGSVSIYAQTEYQLDYANHVLKCRNVADDGFQFMTGECSQDVWDIVEAIKSNEIRKLQQQGVIISYTFGNVEIRNVKSWTDKETIERINSYIEYLKDMVILEIPINETNNEMVKKWCDEVGNEKETQCVFLEKRRLVLAFDKTYDGADRIKHQILIKDGQKRITKRGKRDYPGADKEIDHVINANEASSALNTYKISAKGYTRNKGNPAGNPRRKEEKYPQFDLNQQANQFGLNQQANNLKRFSTPQQLVVYVYEANILKLPVDCIVNAANDTLLHGGGVARGIARVIARAAGRRLDTEGFAHIKKNGKVPVGKVCVTTAGKLHYDCVIHAAGPRWSDYYPHSLGDVQQCENDLYSALTESFKAAENRGLESIALPAISAAKFGVPEELCVYQYAKATLDYSRKQSPHALKEVHFIDINPRIIASIQNMFDAMLEPGHMPDYRTEKFFKTRPQQPTVSKTFEERRNKNKAMRDKPKPVHYMEGENHVFESEKCTLFIQCGDLWKTQADAIVSTEDIEGSGKGKIAKLIHDCVPSWKQKEYLRAKKSSFSGRVRPGKVYVTGGFECGYKKVLHAVVPYEIRFESQEKQQDTIKEAVQNVFQEANKSSIYSVVMGLLGAGQNTIIDVRIATDAFIQAYQDYVQKSDRRLCITLVCREERVFDIVKEKLIEYELMEVVKETPPPLPRRLPHPEDVTEESENLKSPEDCVICMDQIAADRKVLEYGHAFHEEFGYPDPTYLDRVKEELAVKGITVKDIAKKHKTHEFEA